MIGDPLVEVLDIDFLARGHSLGDHRHGKEDGLGVPPTESPAMSDLIVHDDPGQVEVLGHDIPQNDAEGLLIHDIFLGDEIAVDQSLEDLEVAQVPAAKGTSEEAQGQLVGPLPLSLGLHQIRGSQAFQGAVDLGLGNSGSARGAESHQEGQDKDSPRGEG